MLVQQQKGTFWDQLQARKAELLAGGEIVSPAVADVMVMLDVALLRWMDAEATLRSICEAVEARLVEEGLPRGISAEAIASTPIEKLFAGRLEHLRSHRKA
jgi:hypothetical protein